MRPRDLAELLLLAALWGASFLFIRVAVPHFGPLALIELRVAIAAAVLLPLLAWRDGIGALGAYARPIAIVGLVNSAIPFVLLAYATLTFTAGTMSILNSTAPLFGALVAHVWLKDRLTPAHLAGLAVGLAGVAVIAGDRVAAPGQRPVLGLVAALSAGLFYGIGASYAKKRLAGVAPLAVAGGSQAAATLALLPLALAAWPRAAAPPAAWGAVVLLAVASTAIAYILYFRLIASVGPTRAIAVTFLIPAFGVFWGRAVLGEPVTVHMIAGAALVLGGTALTVGVWPRGVRPATSDPTRVRP
jgi:drug/metabolite transporter (DMT)-like permease